MDNPKQMEYQVLRDNIMRIFEVENKIRTAIYPISSVLIAFAFSQKNEYFFLLPLIVLIPGAFRYLALKQEIEQIASYLQVFNEEVNKINWENRLSTLRYSIRDRNEKSIKKVIDFFMNADFLILSFLCVGLFFFAALTKYSPLDLVVEIVILSIYLAFMVFLHKKTINLKNKDRRKYIEDWNKVRNIENID